MDYSTLSSKGQVTIPKAVREALAVAPGDTVAYEVRGGEVVLRRVDPFDAAYHTAISATMSEWASAADGRAFDSL